MQASTMLDSYDDGENGDKALFKGVRVSKYRHVYGAVARKDLCYDNIQITKNAHDSFFCAANPKFLAIVIESCGGGSFIIIPIDKTGRVDTHAGRVTGHRGQIFDIKWNPFNDNVIASCSDDTTIKLWYIPDEGLLSRNMNQPLAELRGHKRRVNFIEWHPTADNILVSAGSDHQLIVWNTLTADAVRVIDCHPETIHSMSFNRDGSLLATTCKDKKLRIIDPRSGQVVNEGLCHYGTKAFKVAYLGDSRRLFTVGFSRYSDRQWAIWSEKDLSAPLTIENIDSSSGVLFPYYDHDTRMVYVAGKGDGNIRYYETTDEHPYCHYLSQFLSGFPQRSLGMMPKRGCDVYRCEIARFYKLHATKSICEPISMIVPRKSEQFQSDVFPDTAAPTPALTADQWLSGQNRNPVLFNLKTGAGAKTNKPVFIKPPIHSNKTAVPSYYSERKLEFISQTNPIDYREKDYLDDVNPTNKLFDNKKLNNQNGLGYEQHLNLQRQNDVKGQGQFVLNGHSNQNGSPKKSHHNEYEAARNRFQDVKAGLVKTESALAQNFRESIANNHKTNNEINNSPSRTRLPWAKANQQDDDDVDVVDFDGQQQQPQSKPKCDIVSVKHLPQAASLITISSNNSSSNDDSDDSAANTTDDSIAEELAFSAMNYGNSQMNETTSNNNSNESFNTSNSETENSSPVSENSVEKSPCIDDLIAAHLSNNPKNEPELWRSFHDQRALIHKLHIEIKEKDKRIEELEKILSYSNQPPPSNQNPFGR